MSVGQSSTARIVEWYRTKIKKSGKKEFDNHLLIEPLLRNDLALLNKNLQQNNEIHHDNLSVLNQPLRYAKKTYDNVLSFYLTLLQLSVKHQEMLTDEQYDIINFLLDNRVPITATSEKILLDLMENKGLWICRLRFKENDYANNPIVSNLLRLEKEKILKEGNVSGKKLNKLFNRLSQHDFRVLINYDDRHHNLNLPLVDDSGKKFDNALHYYLALLQKHNQALTNNQYNVINYLLDNKVALTDEAEKIVYSLIQAKNILAYRLRFEENGYTDEANKIFSYEETIVLDEQKKDTQALEKYWLLKHLCRSDVALLKPYDGINNDILKQPLDKFDNALDFYLDLLSNKHTPATQADYEVINFLLDNKVEITERAANTIQKLVSYGILTTYLLRLSENDYQKSYYLAKKEIAKVIGNTLGLEGVVNISGPYDHLSRKEIELDGMGPLLAMAHLLKALEAFVTSNAFTTRFSQYTKQMQEVITVLKENFILRRQYGTTSINTATQCMMNQLAQGKIVCLSSSGSIDHCAPVMLTPDKIISCNKGDGKQEDKVAIHYQLPRKDLRSMLANLFDAESKDEIADYVNCFKGLKEIDSRFGKDQKVGNCAFAGNRVLYHELMALIINDPIVDEISKAFGAFQRTFALQEFLHSPIVKADKLFALNILFSILRYQHDTSKPDERVRMELIEEQLRELFKDNLVIKALEKKHYPLNVDEFMSMLATKFKQEEISHRPSV